MTMPAGAEVAPLAGGVVLADVSYLLPTGGVVRTRPVERIERVYHHHSGALGRQGFEGVLGTARYTTGVRKWPRIPYTYYLCHEPDRDSEGSLVVYQTNTLEAITYHTGGMANHHGVGVCWQGNLSRKKPSDAQYEMAEALCAYLQELLELSHDRPFSFHSEAGRFGGREKLTCPGPHVEQWVMRWRDGM